MNSGKLRALLGGDPFAPWPVGEGLFPTDRQWHFHRPAGQPGSRELLIARLYQYAGSKGDRPEARRLAR
jgi:hypothetical protein